MKVLGKAARAVQRVLVKRGVFIYSADEDADIADQIELYQDEGKFRFVLYVPPLRRKR